MKLKDKHTHAFEFLGFFLVANVDCKTTNGGLKKGLPRRYKVDPPANACPSALSLLLRDGGGAYIPPYFNNPKIL